MELEVWSDRLGEPVHLVAAHAGQEPRGASIVWLLHGRGTSYDDLGRIVTDLSAAMAADRLPPHTVIAPWGPWLAGAAWWVDDALGQRPIESALLADVLAQAEAAVGAPSGVTQRLVAGYSMGGAAALRWLLTRRDLFAAAALVSPATYATAPPLESSARSSGAFRSRTDAFDHHRWERLMSYRRLLAEQPSGGPTRIAIVVGDAEPVQAYPDGRSSLTLESAKLHVTLRERADVVTSLRVLGGGHHDDFWAPALSTALGLLQPTG